MYRTTPLLLAALTICAPLYSAPGTTKTKSVLTERVGGDYIVHSIKPIAHSGFLVEFRSATTTGRFDVLKLETSNLHLLLNEGQKLRISAELLHEGEEASEVAQVLVFIPGQTGETPVWLLSRKSSAISFDGARYLEMHAPESDYLLF